MGYTDDIALLANIPAQAETLQHCLEWVAAGIGLYVNADKTEYIYFHQKGDISTLNGSSVKLLDKFTYLGSSVSSTETDINTQLEKAWIGIDRLSATYHPSWKLFKLDEPDMQDTAGELETNS